MRYLIDSLDVGAVLLLLVAAHVLVMLAVLVRTYRAAVDKQTPRRSGPVTMVTNGVSETQWRDGWGHQLLWWAGIFSGVFCVGYVLLLTLAVSRWLPGHGWAVPVLVTLFAGVVVFVGWRWWASRPQRPVEGARVVEAVPVYPPAVPEPYAEPYGSWGEHEGL
jgi:peptidoglycan biosynthesis protein MviN/MurJ (putative lipid II flippase)